MIPNTAIRLVSSSHVAESAEFGISVNDTAHIMSILRAQLYSDKILAVLREYSSNAWDAHRDAGKPELPIKVTLPTLTEPTLTIRDFGFGLSPEAVFEVYTQYGASTKRNSDNAVGMLGIGSKSGFAYSDQFSITSFQDGTKRMYVAVLDKSEKGMINLLHEEPCGDETGVEIAIAVRPEDIDQFDHKAKGLFKFFVPRPDINTEVPKLPAAQATMKNGVIYERDQDHYYSERRWSAVMGCVSYNINLDQLRGIDATPEGGVAEFLSNISGALYFSIGEVQVSASREELNYSAETKLALVRKFSELVDEYVKQTLDVIMLSTNHWERRIKAQTLAKLNLPVPVESKDLLTANVGFKDKLPKGIVITQNRTACGSISVNEGTRFVIVDDPRSIQGFQGLSHKDYYVRAVNKDGHYRTAHVQWDLVEGKITELCTLVDIVGIPVIRISSLTWQVPHRNSSGKKINPKHRMKLFKFLPEEGYSKPWSDAWEVFEHEPSKDDVFVIISEFQTRDYDLGRCYKADEVLAKEFGGTLPTIVGYKTTMKKPLTPKDCLGTHYPDWRDKFVPPLLTQQVKDQFALWQWIQAVQQHKNYWRGRSVDKRVFDKMTAELGPDHLITILVKNNYEGAAYFKKHNQLGYALQQLENRLPELKVDATAAQKALDLIISKYPLLQLDGISIAEVWSERSDAWLQYIKLVDKG